MDDMTAKEQFIFLFKSYLKQAEADVKKWTEHLERLEGKKEPVVDVPCSDGLDVYPAGYVQQLEEIIANSDPDGIPEEIGVWKGKETWERLHRKYYPANYA